jgi:hypothetical protein
MPVQVDHANGIKNDNRIENLREATYSQNQANAPSRESESGERGVRLVPSTGKWAARIYIQGWEVRIGTFGTKEEAALAYKERARREFGEFYREPVAG